MSNIPADKGEFNGSCNRSCCLAPGAVWYNHSTRKYYCADCAKLLNDDNRRDALELFGHDLCTLAVRDWETSSLIAVECPGNRIMFTVVDEILRPQVFGKNVLDNFTTNEISSQIEYEKMRLKIVCEFLHGPNERYIIHAKNDYERTGLPLTKIAYLFKVDGSWISRIAGLQPIQHPGVWCVVNSCFCDQDYSGDC